MPTEAKHTTRKDSEKNYIMKIFMTQYIKYQRLKNRCPKDVEKIMF